MNPICDGTNGDLHLWPPWEEWLKDLPAYFSVKFANAADLTAAAKSEVGHVERLRHIARILPAEAEQSFHRNCEFVLRIMSEIFPTEFRVEAVEAGRHCRMGRKHISCPGNGQRKFEGNVVILHITSGAFEHGECRMTFIKVADLRMQPNLAQQAPAANTQNDLLL